MKALLVIGVIVLLLFLIGLIQVGAEAAYNDRGFRFGLRFGPCHVELGRKEKSPQKENKKANKRNNAEKKHTSAKKNEKSQKKLPSLSLLMSIIQRAFMMLGRLVRNLRVDVLKLHFTSAFDDPAVTALAYGAAGTMMEALDRIGGGNIVCSDMRADVDFDNTEPRCDFRITARMRTGRLVGMAARFAVGVLIDYLREKRKEHTHG